MSPLPGSRVIHPRMLEQLQPVAVAAQTGTCRHLRPTGTPVMDSESLEYSSTTPTVVWEGSCRLQPKARALADVKEAGEQLQTLAAYQLTIPIDAPLPHVNDLYLMVTSSDPKQAGQLFRVLSAFLGDLQAERHVTVEDAYSVSPA